MCIRRNPERPMYHRGHLERDGPDVNSAGSIPLSQSQINELADSIGSLSCAEEAVLALRNDISTCRSVSQSAFRTFGVTVLALLAALVINGHSLSGIEVAEVPPYNGSRSLLAQGFVGVRGWRSDVDPTTELEHEIEVGKTGFTGLGGEARRAELVLKLHAFASDISPLEEAEAKTLHEAPCVTVWPTALVTMHVCAPAAATAPSGTIGSAPSLLPEPKPLQWLYSALSCAGPVPICDLLRVDQSFPEGECLVQDAPMQPVRSFNFHNGTGVQITVRWRQGRQSTSVELLPGMCSNVHHLSQNRTHRFAEVRLWLEEFQLEEVVTIDLDHTFGRAYQVREGCPIFVEPEHDLKDGKCTLHIKSALTIHNDTALPLRLTLATAMFQKLSSQVSDLLRSGTRIVSFTQSLEDWDDEAADGRARFKEFQGHLDVPAQSSVEVPVSWFVFSQMHRPSVRLQALGPGFGGVSRHFPQLAALLEDVSIAEDEDFDDEDVTAGPLATGARLRPREAEAERRGDRTKFSLFLRTYMKLSGYIDAQDLPLALDEEDVQQADSPKKAEAVVEANVEQFVI
ncbi:Hypothetical protein (Fragment) [Durusdinium trenchii]|uniref:Uncharacterized protein n=1 Tax=Durusdinium trenchii TaxID=1381693 RepID=A0ABP0KL54_9DINO